ncbi:MAG: hypothetical protein VKL42_06170 [Snowella sp.]|nr:hypothetical protein [Snowella sp.]
MMECVKMAIAANPIFLSLSDRRLDDMCKKWRSPQILFFFPFQIAALIEV